MSLPIPSGCLVKQTQVVGPTSLDVGSTKQLFVTLTQVDLLAWRPSMKDLS